MNILSSQLNAIETLRSVDPSTKISLPDRWTQPDRFGDAVSMLYGEHCRCFAQATGRWEWTAGELVDWFEDCAEIPSEDLAR